MSKLIFATLCFSCLASGAYLLRDVDGTQIIGAVLFGAAAVLGIMSNET
jgi:hypothetical protein